MDQEERQGRIELAAALRLAVRFGYHEAIANHFTLALGEKGDRYLLHPWGKHFAEVRASDMLVVNTHGEVLEGEGEAERSAVCLHGPMHARLPHARCILHTHMPYATALASVEGTRLEPIHQNAARFYDRIAYDDDFNTLALDPSEGERVCRVMGNKSILFMANHGVMVVGRSVAEAFDVLYYLEKACENQVLAMSTGQPLKIIPDEVARRTAEQWANEAWSSQTHFDALKRLLDRDDPDYMH
jgi:ribulose-5-phosphate 4-epimerase/fuculose-1-phosphate aldolase